MFKPGDRLICINNIEDNSIKDKLITGKVYKLISYPFVLHDRTYIFVDGHNFPYQLKYFTNINILRKQKLKKICSKLEIK